MKNENSKGEVIMGEDWEVIWGYLEWRYMSAAAVLRQSDQQEKKKKWGAEEKRGSTLFIKCHLSLRHKAEIPNQAIHSLSVKLYL